MKNELTNDWSKEVVFWLEVVNYADGVSLNKSQKIWAVFCYVYEVIWIHSQRKRRYDAYTGKACMKYLTS